MYTIFNKAIKHALQASFLVIGSCSVLGKVGKQLFSFCQLSDYSDILIAK